MEVRKIEKKEGQEIVVKILNLLKGASLQDAKALLNDAMKQVERHSIVSNEVKYIHLGGCSTHEDIDKYYGLVD